jgi:hypothetical protein
MPLKRRVAALQPWIDLANSLPPDAPPPSGRLAEGPYNMPAASPAYLAPDEKYWVAWNVRGALAVICRCKTGEVAPMVVRGEMYFTFYRDRDGDEVRVLAGPFDHFLATLNGARIAGDRIRQCGICQRFFIALRTDQAACGRACANASRVRRFRANQDKYKRSRRMARRLKLNKRKAR